MRYHVVFTALCCVALGWVVPSLTGMCVVSCAVCVGCPVLCCVVVLVFIGL